MWYTVGESEAIAGLGVKMQPNIVLAGMLFCELFEDCLGIGILYDYQIL